MKTVLSRIVPLIALATLLLVGACHCPCASQSMPHGRVSALQPQGNSSTSEGRLGGELGTAVTTSDFAIGAGWGTTATVTSVATGSNDQRGSVLITASGASFAQATATVTFTFHDGAWASAPFCRVHLIANSNAVTESATPQTQTTTTTALSFTHNVLPVDTKTYRFGWLCVQ